MAAAAPGAAAGGLTQCGVQSNSMVSPGEPEDKRNYAQFSLVLWLLWVRFAFVPECTTDRPNWYYWPLSAKCAWRLAISCSKSAAKPSTDAGSSNTMSRLNEMVVWSLSTASSEIVAT